MVELISINTGSKPESLCNSHLMKKCAILEKVVARRDKLINIYTLEIIRGDGVTPILFTHKAIAVRIRGTPHLCTLPVLGMSLNIISSVNSEISTISQLLVKVAVLSVEVVLI